MHNDVIQILLTEKQINDTCKLLANQIEHDYKNKDNIVLLGLLKGCVPFMADIMKHINLPLEVEYMDVSSYQGTKSSGDIQIKMDTRTSIRDKNIIICEDIVDTGKTLNTIVGLLYHRGAKSVEVVTLLDKPEGRVIPFKPKYIGHTIPKEFVIGYGLDYNEKYRNLPYVGILKKEIYLKESIKEENE